MSGNPHKISNCSGPRKEAKASFAWRSVSSGETSNNRSKWQLAPNVKILDESDQAPDDWQVLLDDSDDSTSGWGQNSSSSSASWSDDLESEATFRLQQQLEVLDKIVFQEKLTPEEAAVHIPSDLLEEAMLWRSSYPHLRIKGTSLPVPPPQDNVEEVEEVISSHGMIEDIVKQCDQLTKNTRASSNTKDDDMSRSIDNKTLAELKADVMKKLFDYLWPDVLVYVKSKILSCSREVSNVVKDTEQLPLRLSHERTKSTLAHQNSQLLVHEPKCPSNPEIPDKYFYKYNNQLSPTHIALDSILKVSRLPLKQSISSNVPSSATHRSYQVLSSRGQTHYVNNRKDHVTLPPIEVPCDSVKSNSFEGSLSQLRSASALSHEHHQLATSRPNTSTLIPTHEKTFRSSYISVSPSNLARNISFNVLGKHMPANSTLPWFRSNQRRTNNTHR